MYRGPVVDAYMHPGWTARTEGTIGARQEWDKDPRRARVMQTFQQSGDKPMTPEASAVETVDSMRSSGVSKGVLVASLYYPSPRPALESAVQEHHELVSQYPEIFTHVGTVLPPLQGPGTYWDLMENPRVVAQHQREFGIQGVHLTPGPWGTPPNDRWYYPLYAKCAELDLVVYSYVGMPGPLWPAHPNDPAHLDDVCLAFPDLSIVAHHIGDPWVPLMIRLAAKHPNLHICTSAWSPKRYPQELLEFMRGKWHRQPGAQKVIFGTDHPFLNQEKVVNDARMLDLPDDVLQAFMHDNAVKLFDL
jgi:uncharacterized protein